MLRDDEIRLRHMLNAAKDAVAFSIGKSRSELDNDRQFALALVKSIEIIGEAASRITQETKDENPQIPWMDIIGMRNRLIHAYFSINLDIVWATVNGELPDLIKGIENILSEIPE